MIIWLAAVVGVQFAAYSGMLLLIVAALLLTPSLARRWWMYTWRARWLLLVLWLVLAYNTPGESLDDLSWAPTYEGVAEANLQAVRLVVMLACLAWLFQRQGSEGMIAGLWGLLQPVRALGFDAERVVVRLALVLENLQAPQEKGAWRKMLAVQPAQTAGPQTLSLRVAPWMLRDSILVVLSGFGLMGAALL